MEQNNIWCEVSERAQHRIKERYKNEKGKANFEACSILEELFGKDNVCEKEILTWDDLCRSGLVTSCSSISIFQMFDCPISSGKCSRKALATLKISQLVDVAYGGIPSREEIENGNVTLYHVSLSPDGTIFSKPWNGKNISAFLPLVFKTQELAEKFLTYNKELVCDFFMIPVVIRFDESD